MGGAHSDVGLDPMDGFGADKTEALDALSYRIDYYGGELLQRNFRSVDGHTRTRYYVRDSAGYVRNVRFTRKNHVTRARTDGT